MACLVGFMCYLFQWKIISLLTEKRLNPDFTVPEINEVDIYQFDPFELPGLSETNSDDQAWYFFCEPYYKYSKSKRAHRATAGGYWKITGKGCKVKDRRNKWIGSKKTLVFYRRGLTSKKGKTDWVMHEFCVKDTDNPRYKRDFVVCYIEKKPNSKSNVSTPDDGQPSQNLPSDSESHVTENPSPEVESEPLQSSYNLVSDSRNHFPARTTSSMVEHQLLAEVDSINWGNWLNQNSEFAQQFPINPDHGFNGVSNDCNVRGHQLDSTELENVTNAPWDFLNEHARDMDVLTDSEVEAFIQDLFKDSPET